MDIQDFWRSASIAFFFAVKPFLLVVLLAVPLWLVRKWFPRAEFWLFSPLGSVIRRLAGRARRDRTAQLLSDQAVPAPSRRHPLSRD
jgi:hypothetical protein